MLTTRTRITAAAVTIAIAVLAVAATLTATHHAGGIHVDSLIAGVFVGVVLAGLTSVGATEYAHSRSRRRLRQHRLRPGGPVHPLTAAQARQQAEQRLADARAQQPEINRILTDQTRTRLTGCYTPPPTGCYIPPETTTTNPAGSYRPNQ